MFSRFQSKTRVRGNRHECSFKDRTDWFSTIYADWTWLSNRYIRFWIFWKSLKMITKIFVSQKLPISFWVSKSRNICITTPVDEYVYKMSSCFLGKRLSFAVLNSQKWLFLCCLREFRYFSDFQILSDLSCSKSILGSFFVFLTKIWL